MSNVPTSNIHVAKEFKDYVKRVSEYLENIPYFKEKKMEKIQSDFEQKSNLETPFETQKITNENSNTTPKHS